jgi:hypothetical protein
MADGGPLQKSRRRDKGTSKVGGNSPRTQFPTNILLPLNASFVLSAHVCTIALENPKGGERDTLYSQCCSWKDEICTEA